MPGTADELAAKIRDEIASGKLAPGDRLPTLRQYRAEGYGAGVVNGAIDRLRAEGLVTTRQGSGTYVRATFKLVTRISPDRHDPDRLARGEAVQDADIRGRWHTVGQPRVGYVRVPEDLAEAFNLGFDDEVLRRWRVYTVDGRPVQIAISYLPIDITRGTRIEHSDTGPGGTPARLREMGWPQERFQESVRARGPRPDEIEALSLRKSGDVVFEVTRLAWSNDRCVEATVMILDAEAYELIYKFDAPPFTK